MIIKKHPVSGGFESIYHISQTELSRSLIWTPACGITYPSESYKMLRNRSPVMCIEYVESGEGVICADNERYNPHGGDTYMLQIGENQHYWSSTSNPWKKYWVNIKGPVCKKLCEAYKLTGSHYFPGLDIKKDLEQIIELAKDTTADHTVTMLEVINRIFFKMYEYNSKRSSQSDAVKIKDYIDMRITEDFSLDEVEKLLEKSQSQIIRIFKKQYGITPYAYHLDKRIEVAKELLLGTSLKVKEIAEYLNFYDEYYFSNIFLRKTGQTPSHYRKQSTEG